MKKLAYSEKNTLIGILAIAIFAIVAFVFSFGIRVAFGAETFSGDGGGYLYTDVLNISYTCDGNTDIVVFNPNGVALGGNLCSTPTSGIFNISTQDLDNWIVTPGVLGTYKILMIEDNDACILSGWDGASDDYTNCFSLHSTPIATYTLVSQNNQSIWAGGNGFWGSTTAGDVAGSLTASVQNTGVNIYALISFVGIPLAFLLALWLISLINKQLTPPKKEEKKGQKYDFIEHTPQDLELQREYGHVEKRKRGRPRKTL